MNKKKLKETAQKYTRHPAGSPGGKGGEFAPKTFQVSGGQIVLSSGARVVPNKRLKDGEISLTKDELMALKAKVIPATPESEPKPEAGIGSGLDASPLGGKIKDKLMDSDLGSLGDHFVEQPDSMLFGNAKPDPAMVKAFSGGQINATPAFVIRKTAEDDGFNEYSEAVDPVSARILASAKAAGADANTIVVSPSDGKLAAMLHKASGNPHFVSLPKRQGYGFNEVGNLMTVSADEITGGKPNISQADVDAAAKAIRSGNGRAFMPVVVKETSPDSYEVISGAEQLAIAARANVDPWIYIADDFRDPPPVEKLKKVARRRKA